jgi:hypothetical protein
MATWVVYHNNAKPEVLEYVIEDAPEGTTKEDIRNALSVGRDCRVNPGVEVRFALHGISKLGNAPSETQAANADGKAYETLKWRDIGTPTRTTR